MIRYFFTFLALQLAIVAVAEAQVEQPKISSATFDDDGKLIVKTKFSAIAGCYVSVNGGLSRNDVETGITSVQLSEAQATRGAVTLKTRRRYYCQKRTLYVNVELVCLNEVIGSATSAVKAVTVPSSNVRR